MNIIDAFLNKITMYRLMLYSLTSIVIVAFGLSAAGSLSFPLPAMAASIAVLLTCGAVAHYALRWAFNSATGVESWLITVLILFLILRPANDVAGLAVLGLGAVLAMSSKYLLAIANMHVFNPAAIALVCLGLLGSDRVYWWVATGSLLPIVLVAGLLVARKIKRIKLVSIFTMTALCCHAVSSDIGFSIGDLLSNAVISGPLVFTAVIMLTEPSTTPSTRRLQYAYAGLAGILYGVHFQAGPLFSTPELAIVISNALLFAASTRTRRRYRLEFVRQAPLGGGVYEFAFIPDRQLRFVAGQYMEWTLPHKNTDSRGNRRYFTVSSSPYEQEVRICVRIDSRRPSSFKRKLLMLKPGDTIWAALPGGDFILPPNPNKRLVWIAGGIGVTPFRSMAGQLLMTNHPRDITFFYCSQNADGFAYWQTFNDAARLGLKSNYVITGQELPPEWKGMAGRLSGASIQSMVPAHTTVQYYLSGPPAMVSDYAKILRKANVPRHQIRTDYFPGY